MPLVAELEKIRRETEAINAQVSALWKELSEEQLARRVEPGQWSIAEHVLHLRVTTEVFLPSVDQAIDEARRKQLYGNGPFSLGLMDRFFVWYVEPPPAIRLPAPKPLRVLLTGPARDVLPAFLESQAQMMQRVEAANGLDLVRALVTSPLARYIRMSLLAFFCVGTGHARRHLWHAANVRARLG
jgi:hypothetical protein